MMHKMREIRHVYSNNKSKDVLKYHDHIRTLRATETLKQIQITQKTLILAQTDKIQFFQIYKIMPPWLGDLVNDLDRPQLAVIFSV